MVFVFDFGFGERGVVVDAPVHRLEAAIDVALLVEIEKRAGDGSFVPKIHREIWLVPLAKDAEAAEFDFVVLDESRGELTAHLAKFGGGNFGGFAAEFLFDFGLNRQPVAIPARDVRGAEAGHGLGLHDHVFHDFVQARAEVDFAGGVRRPVMQDEKRRAGARFEDAFIQARRLPSSELFRLALRQFRLHGEIGFGKIQGLFEVNVFGHVWALKPFSTAFKM